MPQDLDKNLENDKETDGLQDLDFEKTGNENAVDSVEDRDTSSSNSEKSDTLKIAEDDEDPSSSLSSKENHSKEESKDSDPSSDTKSFLSDALSKIKKAFNFS